MHVWYNVIFHPPPPPEMHGLDYRIATISGDPPNCQKAKMMVDEIVEEVKKNTSSVALHTSVHCIITSRGRSTYSDRACPSVCLFVCLSYFETH